MTNPFATVSAFKLSFFYFTKPHVSISLSTTFTRVLTFAISIFHSYFFGFGLDLYIDNVLGFFLFCF